MEIPAKVLDLIEAEAIKAFPKESCGLLVGKKRVDLFIEAIPAPNLSPGPDQFLIDPEFHLKTQRELREQGLEIIGVYHSHPGGDSTPSTRDRAGPNTPGFYWLITSLAEKTRPKTSLFRENPTENGFTSRNFDKVPLQIEKFVA
ncbi:MAG: M67 family metallopeptidase [Sphingomonadales bacterium]